ncbi:hypothetical protein PTKIN_Ptkin13bG0205700 [Pterospermum kingtungense]
MEERLTEAAQAGDTNALYASIREDPDVFRRIDDAQFADTPLHIAAARGNTDFAIAVMYLRPSFGRKLNRDVLSPIHLALQNQHSETVLRLLALDNDLVRVKGKEGYTALHCVAEQGDLHLLAQFLQDCPACIEDLTIRNETALHLAAQNNRLEAVEIIARWLRRSHLYGKVSRNHLLDFKDRDGNTVLHIAAYNTQPQMMKVLLECKVEAKEINTSGLTAMEVLENQTQSPNRETSLHILRSNATGFMGFNPFRAPSSTVTLHDKLRSKITSMEETVIHFKCKVLNMSANMINALLVVLTLILTATYQALINPPGGVWQGDPTADSSTINLHHVGTSVMDLSSFHLFFRLNFLVFVSTSFLTIGLLQIVSGSNSIMVMIELLLVSLFCCVKVAWRVISPVDPSTIHSNPLFGDGPSFLFVVCMLLLMEIGRRVFLSLPARARFFTRFYRQP